MKIISVNNYVLRIGSRYLAYGGNSRNEYVATSCFIPIRGCFLAEGSVYQGVAMTK